MLNDYRDTIYHCLKCGACRVAYRVYEPICPSGIKFGFDSYYAIGRIGLARALIDKEIKIDSNLMRRVYTCTSCGACDEQCHDAVGIDPLQIIEEIKYEAVGTGMIPPEVRDFLKRMNIHGNPYGLPTKDRGKWAEGIPVENYSNQEYLFYVGDVGSYDERAMKIARSVAEMLLEGGVSFGILGDREMSDGNEVNRVGERGLFEYMAIANIQRFQEMGIQRIITLSPHAYNAFRNDYPRWGGKFDVCHYSQALAELLEGGRIKPSGKGDLRVTFHDPCFLGRHNQRYDAPRTVLDAIPNVKRVEMERSRGDALCCGGGGGNFFTDMLGTGERSPGRIRVREAIETGAECIATACPKCFNMLDDAVKTEGAEDRIVVKDLSQLL